jgi:hypothetical protein
MTLLLLLLLWRQQQQQQHHQTKTTLCKCWSLRKSTATLVLLQLLLIQVLQASALTALCMVPMVYQSVTLWKCTIEFKATAVRFVLQGVSEDSYKLLNEIQIPQNEEDIVRDCVRILNVDSDEVSCFPDQQ